MSTPEGRRRTRTLSISLPHELAEEISKRLESGLYTSASELIREALRLLIRTEEAERVRMERLAPPDAAGGSSAASRFATTMRLLDLGASLSAARLLQADGDLPEDEARERVREWEERQEAGPGLRIAPERLAKLKLRE